MQLVGEMPSTRDAVRRVDVEHDAQRDHLALAGGERGERRLEVGREAFGEALVDPLGHGGELLAARAPPLGAEVVERDGARDLAEPGLRRAARGSKRCQSRSARSNVSPVRSSAAPRSPVNQAR